MWNITFLFVMCFYKPQCQLNFVNLITTRFNHMMLPIQTNPMNSAVIHYNTEMYFNVEMGEDFLNYISDLIYNLVSHLVIISHI